MHVPLCANEPPSTASTSTLKLTSGLAILSATSARSNRSFLTCYPMLLSSHPREGGSELTPGRSMVLWRSQSATPVSESLQRTKQESLRNSARWEATMLTKRKERDLG